MRMARSRVGFSELLVLLCLLGLRAEPACARDDWQLWLEQKWQVKLQPQLTVMGRSDVRFRDDMS